jgi:hypothetical protein
VCQGLGFEFGSDKPPASGARGAPGFQPGARARDHRTVQSSLADVIAAQLS